MDDHHAHESCLTKHRILLRLEMSLCSIIHAFTFHYCYDFLFSRFRGQDSARQGHHRSNWTSRQMAKLESPQFENRWGYNQRKIHTVTLPHIHSGYTISEQPVQAPNWMHWCYLATPKQPWMQMKCSTFTPTHVIRAYCHL